MNRSRIWLALAAVCLTLHASAAPVPVPAPQAPGPVTEALRLRALLPSTAALPVSPAVMAGEGIIAINRTRMVPVQETIAVKVMGPGGMPITEYRTTTTTKVVQETVQMQVSACKFYVVTKEGKLEALDADKATAQLKKRTAVLMGDSADVDPRTLELVKPGTLCVITPPPTATAPPPIPDEKPRN